MIAKQMNAGLFPGLARVLFCLVTLLAAAQAQADQILLSAGIAGDSQRTRFVAFLSKKVEYRIFSIAEPYRIVVDLPEVDIQVPGAKGRGLILSSRSGQLAPGRSRIVIDLAEPVLVEKSELLPPENDLPARLVIDLTRSSHKAFVAAAKTPPPVQRPNASQSAASAKNPEDKRPLIVVDPGHGGVDAGAHGRISGIPEKDLTLDFCKAMAARLQATGRYRVIMTRDQDVFVPLDERAQMASGQKADLLVSIHADTLDVKRFGIKSLQEVRGGTIYTLSEEASDEQAGAMEQNENKADVEAGVANETRPPSVSEEISGILSDLENRSKRNRSLAAADSLIERLKGQIKFNSRPHRSANLRVLKAAGVPAILIELGYLSNDEDEKLLTSSDWRAAKAAVIADAISAFMSER